MNNLSIDYDEILITAPGASGDNLRRIIDICKLSGKTFKTVPSLNEMINKDVNGIKYRFYVSDDMENTGTIEKEIVGNNDNTFTFDKKWVDPWVKGPAEPLFWGEFETDVLI